MNSFSIYWPMLLQLLIPILVLLLNAKRKSVDRKAGTVDREAAAMDNEAWSKPVVLTSKNLANQFQFPVVFYVLCLALASMNAVSSFALTMAWVYVALRLAHAIIHVTSNNVALRMPVFIASMLVLISLFVATVLALAKHT